MDVDVYSWSKLIKSNTTCTHFEVKTNMILFSFNSVQTFTCTILIQKHWYSFINRISV